MMWHIDTIRGHFLFEWTHAMNKLFLLTIIAALVAGCGATRKEFYAAGGSRADGTIDMAYDFIKKDKKIVADPRQAESIASNKCMVWGYQRAEAFGGKGENCHARAKSGQCIAGQVIVKYQCIGNINPAAMSYQQPMPYQQQQVPYQQQPMPYQQQPMPYQQQQPMPYQQQQQPYQQAPY